MTPGNTYGVSLRVLIVDDHTHFRETAAALVRRQGLVVAAIAGSLREALQLAGDRDVDAALIDVHLPDGSGVDLADRLNTQGPAIRVLLTSSDRDAVSAEDGDDGGAPAFVAKANLAAVDLRELLARTNP
jgi:DNA-binding NarL/FixJ family response regulator